MFPVIIQEPSIHTPPKIFLKIFDVTRANINEWAVLDSGVTSHFLVVDVIASKVTPADNPTTGTIPDGTTLRSIHVHKLDLPTLPMTAIIRHVSAGLASHSLCNVSGTTNIHWMSSKLP